MRKIIIALLLVSLITTSAYAVSIFDRIVDKEVVLVANKMSVLVNRITGEVKFLLLNNGQWMLLTPGVLKNQCQAMYNAQTYGK